MTKDVLISIKGLQYEISPDEAIERMNKLSDDKIAYDSAREKAYKFMKSLFDVKPVYSKLLKEIWSSQKQDKMI